MALDRDSAISVIMPVLNEEQHLATSVAKVLAQPHRGPIELVLAVGPSRDRTRQIADELAAGDQRIRVIDNPSGTTPDGLNLAIAASTAPIIIRVDAHGELADDYFTTAVDLLVQTGAVNVGGRMDARGTTDFERAVALAYNSRLGLGGGGFHLADTPQGPAETVFLGCFRRDALVAAGGYDPDLRRAQDWELNLRLRQAGGSVVYSPKLRVTYRPRSSVRALARQFFRTGQWRREVTSRNPQTASLRYLAPPTLVAGLAGGLGLSLAARPGRRWPLIGLLAPLAYLTSIGVASQYMARRSTPGARAWAPLVLVVMHTCWGLGYLVGVRPDQRHATNPAPRPDH